MFNARTPVTIEPPAPAMPVSGVPGGPGGYGESEVHLLDRLSVLYRYRNVVVAVIIVVLVGGAVQTYTTTKEYRAHGTVQINPDRPIVQGSTGVVDEDPMYAQATEIQTLRSHQLAFRVARKLNLQDNPEYNGKEAQPTGLGDAVLSLRQRLLTPITSLFKADPPAATTPPETPAPAATPAAPTDVDVETPEEAARVSLLMDRTEVTPQLGTRLVDISVTSRHPQFAADAVNAFMREYVERNLEDKTRQFSEAERQYQKSADQVQDELSTLKKNYQEALEKTPAGGNIDPTQLANFVAAARSKWQDAGVTAQNLEAEYNSLKSIKLDDEKAVDQSPRFSGDPVVSQYMGDIVAKTREKQRLMETEKLGPNNSRIVALDTDILSARQNMRLRLVSIVETARQNFNLARATEERYRNTYEEQNKMANSQANVSIPISFLKDEITRKQALLDEVTKNAETARVQARATANNVKIGDVAQVPSAPFKPNAASNMLMALLAGLVLALGLAFGLDYLDDTVKTPEDITRKLHVPFLGLVPAARGEKQPVLSGPVPHDFGESYRALRTSLVFTSGGESTRVITVTSAQPLEGKTTTACNLAMVLAFGGSRVLLIDADMRRPGVHKALKVNNTVGLSHLLVGQARVREAIQRTSDPNFCVMTAGRTPPNPSELLSSERMRQLITNLKQGPFDWVVIDTPPVLAVTDAIIVTPLVDGVTFVVGAEMTRRRLAERAVQMIMASRPKVVGAVLNRVNFDRNKYYYSRYYGYQYKSYYGTHTSGAATAAPKD